MRKITKQLATLVAVVVFTVGLTAVPAQARGIELEIGDASVCKIFRLFDFITVYYDCDPEEPILA